MNTLCGIKDWCVIWDYWENKIVQNKVFQILCPKCSAINN